MKIILDHLPLPPSENNCYPTNRKTGRRFPSKELKDFQTAMKEWRVKHIRIANRARDLLVAGLGTPQRPIRIDRYFAFRHSRIFTLSGGAKKLDASNRVKPLDDALCEHVLGMDDCWIWAGTATKITCVDPADECSIVVMQHVEPLTLESARACSVKGDPMVLNWS